MLYDYKPFYRRKLPHLHTPGSTLFVTFRLADSIPQSVIRQWHEERTLLGKQKDKNKSEIEIEFRRRWFARFEEALHRGDSGPHWLANPAIAQLVADSLLYRDQKVYSLDASCIMSNHGHTVFTPLLNELSLAKVPCSDSTRFKSVDPPLNVIMKSLKGYTARQANKLLNRTGSFWEEESFDHQVRSDSELSRIVRYVLDNPVKAGLVDHWSQWKWSYVSPALAPEFE